MKRNRLRQRLSSNYVELLEGQITGLENQLSHYHGRLGRIEEARLFKDLMMNPRGQGILGAVYGKTARRKIDIVQKVDRIRDTSIYNAIIDVLLNDSLAPSVITKGIVKLDSKNKNVKAALDELQEHVNIDELVMNIAEDLLSYGEYFNRVVTSEDIKDKKDNYKGVVEVVDNVGQGEVTALYKSSKPVGYLEQTGRELTMHDPSKFIHFCLGRRKLRIKVEGNYVSTKQEVLPEYVRIGRPLFYGNFTEVMNLNLLSSLVPASYLHKINNTSIIGITVSGQTDPQEAFNICRKYENILNKATSFDPNSGDMTVADVLNAAGRHKVIPIYAEDQKGTLTKMDPRFEEMTDLGVVQELKKDICGSIGVPYNFIYGGDILKGDQLKQFARYVRKILMVQTAIGVGLTQLASIHLTLKGLTPAPDHIQVKFSNALISVDELDKVEFLDLLGSTLSTITTSLFEIAEKTKSTIDGPILQKFLDRFLVMMDLENAFKAIPKDLKPPEEE